MEIFIHTAKERTICDYHNMIYKKSPKLMVMSSLESNIIWINVFPKKNGISKTLNNSATVLGTPKIDATNSTLQTVFYVHCNIKARGTNKTKK